MQYCRLETRLLQLSFVQLFQAHKSSSESITTLLSSSAVSASFNDHLETCYVTYTGCQSDNECTRSTITYRALRQQQPTYISSLLVNHTPAWPLRSTNQGLLNIPCANREPLLAQDVFHLLLQLFGTIYQLTFALLTPSEVFVRE